MVHLCRCTVKAKGSSVKLHCEESYTSGWIHHIVISWELEEEEERKTSGRLVNLDWKEEKLKLKVNRSLPLARQRLPLGLGWEEEEEEDWENRRWRRGAPWLMRSCDGMSWKSEGWTSGCVFSYQVVSLSVCGFVCACVRVCVPEKQHRALLMTHWLNSPDAPTVCETKALTIPILYRKFPFSIKTRLKYCAATETSVGDLCGYTNYKYLQ